VEELIAAWDGESVSVHRDRETDTWMFICVHSTKLGSAAGGTRMKHYPRPTDALADGMRLSEAMSLKFACVDFPHGGGKAVIALPTPEIPQGAERRRLLREYGAFINSLGGLYSCAPDMNTSAVDMDVIAEVSPYVFCKTEAAGGSGDTAPDTAVGVFHGIRASCLYAFGSDDLSQRTVLVQGAGGVGGRLIELLGTEDVNVIATDIDPHRLAALRDKGIRVVAAEDALRTECDVLAPCATGGIISCAAASSPAPPTISFRFLPMPTSCVNAASPMRRTSSSTQAGCCMGVVSRSSTGRGPSWPPSWPGSAPRSPRYSSALTATASAPTRPRAV